MRKVYLIIAAMMLLCLTPMPYGYFQLVRFLSTLAFGVMTYRYYLARKEWLAYTCGTLALLFQPFYKIALGRTVWNIVDVIVAIGLIILFFYEWKKGDYRPVNNLTTTPVDIIGESLDDNSYEFTLQGKLAPKELVYVAAEENIELTNLFENQPEIFEGWGKMIGFHIVYMPILIKRLKDKKVLQYRAPYLSDTELKSLAIGNDFLLQYLENPTDKAKMKQGFIRTENIYRAEDGKDKAINRFYPLSSKSGEPLADQLHRIGKQISAEEYGKGRYIEGKTLNDYHEEDDDTGELIDEVKERIAKLRQRGISEYILEQLIHPDNRLSTLNITKEYRILLPDYQNMEIKMEPLTKAVYLLFLKHPEGIAFKYLPDYRQELAVIYNKLRPMGLSDKAMHSIEDVTNPLLNSINEKCARIRGAFVGEFDDYMARYYYIVGKRGEAKKITLSRDLVIWEE